MLYHKNMKQYFFLPKHYDTLIADNVSNYLNKGGDFTIVTGVYKETENNINTENSLVYSKLINGEIIYVKQGYVNQFDNKNYELIGFCLEGNLQINAPEIYNQILSLSDCFVFDTPEEFLIFVKDETTF